MKDFSKPNTDLNSVSSTASTNAPEIITLENVSLPEISEAESLCNDVKKILVHSDQALSNVNVKENVEKIERWIESYRRGLSAAQKISDNGAEILEKTKEQLMLSLDELLRLEDEGGNVANKQQSKSREEITKAINRINNLIPVVENSFQSAAGKKVYN